MLKRFLLIMAGCGLIVSSCEKASRDESTASGNRSQIANTGEKLPDFTLKTLAGDKINLRRLEGEKIVVVNFWATWCGPCRREIPDFNRVYSRYRNRGVEILGISVDQSPETEVPPFMKKNPIAYPVLIGSPELTLRYGVRALPTTFIIDHSGKIRRRIIGMTSAATLEAELEKLL
ncbi:MAG: TlpA family protein disulfide reductase [candidate division KSB1 bacterium]|nr:TlpA family protein disulfide reductase [candidate division KSB1 bacterium]MDZ7301738.1 TlpA family protein disulfide reductase [candidate division KSB1 bacterium]MDZ7311483.1 TlpA family protein disulfide reductase [candidate division KSB1 bacterium]